MIISFLREFLGNTNHTGGKIEKEKAQVRDIGGSLFLTSLLLIIKSSGLQNFQDFGLVIS